MESTTGRLGIIVDDRPSAADVVQWCEPVPRGAPSGFVVIDVWSGDDQARESIAPHAVGVVGCPEIEVPGRRVTGPGRGHTGGRVR